MTSERVQDRADTETGGWCHTCHRWTPHLTTPYYHPHLQRCPTCTQRSAKRNDQTGWPPLIHSPSSLQLFAQCPKRYYLRYLRRLPDPSGPEAFAGTHAHAVLEWCVPNRVHAPDLVREVAQREWPAIEADPDFDPEWTAQVKRLSWQATQTALAHRWCAATVPVAHVEQRFDVMLPGRVPLRGVIDRVDQAGNCVSIIDYKTGKAPKRAFQDSWVEKRLQVVWYAAAWEVMSGVLPTSASLLFLGGGRAEEDTVRLDRETVDEALGVALERSLGIGEATASGEWPTNAKALCAWCAYVADCPAGMEVVNERIRKGQSIGPPAETAIGTDIRSRARSA